MEAMQAAGMPAAEVFRSATIVAAQAMGLGEETGLVAVGRMADLVVLEGDPTADIANARGVRLVVRRGASYGREELRPTERRE
jgi:imidazolonepropionase-like amidohydrolase